VCVCVRKRITRFGPAKPFSGTHPPPTVFASPFSPPEMTTISQRRRWRRRKRRSLYFYYPLLYYDSCSSVGGADSSRGNRNAGKFAGCTRETKNKKRNHLRYYMRSPRWLVRLKPFYFYRKNPRTDPGFPSHAAARVSTIICIPVRYFHTILRLYCSRFRNLVVRGIGVILLLWFSELSCEILLSGKQSKLCHSCNRRTLYIL